MSCIRTFTGRLVDPLNLKPADIDHKDIAHALAFRCRFNGHTRAFYSIAEHCVHVATMLPGEHSAADRLAGLLHDASEAYLPDMPAPVKHTAEMLEFRVIELRIMNAVAQRFGINSFDDEAIHRADKRMVATEARDLMAGGCVGYDPDYPAYGDLDLRQPVAPIVAERLWLDRFHTWTGGLANG